MSILSYKRKRKRPRRDSNPQASDPKSDALSIRPRSQSHEVRDLLCNALGVNMSDLMKNRV